MLITDRPSADVEALRSRLYGEVYGPDDDGWDEARRAWNLAVDQRPAAVAFPRDRRRRRRGRRLRPRGRPARRAAGHGPRRGGDRARSSARSCSRTTRMRGVRIDPGARRARVRAGALWADVTAPAARATASRRWRAPRRDVGVVGYTLGGGLSWLARKHGFACDSVLAIELVTADGELVRKVTREHEPELFRALRGGGGNFGVVTAIEFKLYPRRGAHGGRDGVAVGARPGDLHRLARVDRASSRTTSRRCAGCCRSRTCPTCPAPLRGRQLVVIEAAILGDARTSARPAARARARARPVRARCRPPA